MLLTDPHTIWVVECAPFGQISGLRLELPLLLDVKGRRFIWSVGLISTAVIRFSRDYISIEKHRVRFHSLVILFIASMVLLISSPNLLAAIIGWDGLGVTSFLLVVYFQSPKALRAGMLTALTNRVGDVTLITSIVL
jgi:NADH-ubiquinone oxidoreductase chain 5